MVEKAKCGSCNERDVFSKGLCSSCYGKEWRLARKEQRAMKLSEAAPAEALVSFEPEVITAPSEHLTALSPTEMQAAQGNVRGWLERRLTGIEQEIVQTNAALNEARRNKWNTSALTNARNRLVEDETFYNKLLVAAEAGHTIIPDFPIDVFAVKRTSDSKYSHDYDDYRSPSSVEWANDPMVPDSTPVGGGNYYNPVPAAYGRWVSAKNPEGTNKFRVGRATNPIIFPHFTARAPIMAATSKAMEEKCFDQIGVCHPNVTVNNQRQVQQGARAGDPLVIGQVIHPRRRRVVSFIIGWYLDLNTL